MPFKGSVRSSSCPCEGLDPFCKACVPFGRHLDPGIQARRWAAWQSQEALLRRVEQAKRDHPGKPRPGTFPALPERRKAASLTPGELAARLSIGVRHLLRIEAEPTHCFEPSLVLRLCLALGIPWEEAGGVPDSPAGLVERAERGRETS